LKASQKGESRAHTGVRAFMGTEGGSSAAFNSFVTVSRKRCGKGVNDILAEIMVGGRTLDRSKDPKET